MSNPNRFTVQRVSDWRTPRGELISRGVKVRVGDFFTVVPEAEFNEKIDALSEVA